MDVMHKLERLDEVRWPWVIPCRDWWSFIFWMWLLSMKMKSRGFIRCNDMCRHVFIFTEILTMFKNNFVLKSDSLW